jgi:anti-sigma factor RsiW
MEPLPEVDVWPVIDRHLSGEASEHEIEVVRAWLAADPARADLVAELRRVRELGRDRPPARGTNAAWGAVARAVGITSPRGRTTRVTIGRAPAADRSSWIAAAAIVFVLAGGATALSVLTSPKAPQAVVPSSASRVYVTPVRA